MKAYRVSFEPAGPARRSRNKAWLLAASLAVLGACSGQTRATWAHEGKLRFEGAGKPGSEMGLWSWWYKNGQLREQGRYRDGHRYGTWTQWFKSGQRASAGERAWNRETGGSEREGPWTFWHENGQLRARGAYRAGKREGAWEYWNDAGEVDERRAGVYKNDERVP